MSGMRKVSAAAVVAAVCCVVFDGHAAGTQCSKFASDCVCAAASAQPAYLNKKNAEFFPNCTVSPSFYGAACYDMCQRNSNRKGILEKAFADDNVSNVTSLVPQTHDFFSAVRNATINKINLAFEVPVAVTMADDVAAVVNNYDSEKHVNKEPLDTVLALTRTPAVFSSRLVANGLLGVEPKWRSVAAGAMKHCCESSRADDQELCKKSMMVIGVNAVDRNYPSGTMIHVTKTQVDKLRRDIDERIQDEHTRIFWGGLAEDRQLSIIYGAFEGKDRNGENPVDSVMSTIEGMMADRIGQVL
jgi:hypothetical protein